MTVKDLTCETYHALQTELLQNSHRNPFCPIYEKKLSVDGECYTLFILLEKYKVYLLYALRPVFESDERMLRYEMITKGNILAALTELIVRQTKDKATT